MPIIEVDHLSKEYRLGAFQGLTRRVRSASARLLGRPVHDEAPFKALDDVSFSVEPGEVVGIIGHNGAGKSTLLKMLARITTPTSGHVKAYGRIAPLIEVGAGFIGEFTGRENVYLNGAILGMSRREIDRKFDEIVDFAEMAKFIDTPVKRYSSGMQVRLAFAVATSVESEILIVDEVLAVGDLAFQRKCFDRMEELIKKQGRTVLLVSHNIRQVERLCSRVLLMETGRCVLDAPPQIACNDFYRRSDQKTSGGMAGKSLSSVQSISGTGELKLIQVALLDANGLQTESVAYGQPCRLRLLFHAESRLSNLVFGIGFHTPDLLYVANDDSILSEVGPQSFEAGEFSIEYTIRNMILFPGVYAVRVGVGSAANDRTILYGENLRHFQVESGELSTSRLAGQGFFALNGLWQFVRGGGPIAVESPPAAKVGG